VRSGALIVNARDLEFYGATGLFNEKKKKKEKIKRKKKKNSENGERCFLQ
jgi:hypothetical protein